MDRRRYRPKDRQKDRKICKLRSRDRESREGQMDYRKTDRRSDRCLYKRLIGRTDRMDRWTDGQKEKDG
jgi:hypothetical protein